MQGSNSRLTLEKGAMEGSAGLPVDLRSDTVTKPTFEMYEAIRNARLGDDVYGEDPTVNELEQEAAVMLGKEDAIFLPTCTSANLIATIQHCSDCRLSEVIAGDSQHTVLFETGNAATIGGVSTRAVSNQEDGTMRLEDIARAIRIDDIHFPKTKMIVLENTQNSCGGQPLPVDYVDRVGNLAVEKGVKLHIDGARLFNASTALRVPASVLCKSADSVSLCLSKGLCSPAGSLLVGNSEFVHGARHLRKALGGGMRQAGILAACGLVSLRSMSMRLGVDHDNARMLANGLSELKPHILVDARRVRTNMVFFNVAQGKGQEFCHVLERDHKVLIGAYSDVKIRAVTHHDVNVDMISYALDAIRKTVETVFK